MYCGDCILCCGNVFTCSATAKGRLSLRIGFNCPHVCGHDVMHASFVCRGNHSNTAYAKVEAGAGAAGEESEEEIHSKPAMLKTSSI